MNYRDIIASYFGAEYTSDIYISELISFIIGIKPVIYAAYKEAEIENFRSVFPEAHIVKTNKNILGERKEIALISRDRRLAEQAAENVSNNYELGKFLGYPECCVKRHVKRVTQAPYIRGRQLIFDIFPPNQSAPFVINNLLNFPTRLDTPEDFKNADEYWRKNSESNHLKFLMAAGNEEKEINLLNVSFITHLPCRYDCEKSVEIGRLVAKWMKENIPELFDFFKNALQRPFLIFNTFDWIAFDGKVENGILKYTGTVPPFTFVENRVKQNLSLGDSLVAEKDRIVIFKDSRPVFEYKKKDEVDGYLVDFVDLEIRPFGDKIGI
ncbi:MAG TPA: hypothetical protein PLH22_01695 [Candidatus Colwellbacteria bacterium]|nr:hypothetical protein [Candidatus Colwellbacteria bacterium]